MDSATFAAAISGSVALIVTAVSASLTYYLTKRSEHEADWRKLKIERYDEYVAALSGIVEGRDVTPEAQARLADAFNNLAIVTPLAVLTALSAYQDEISIGNLQRSRSKHDQLLNELVNIMRRDVYPGWRRNKDTVSMQLLSVPPISPGHS